jgi:hypothetical protein
MVLIVPSILALGRHSRRGPALRLCLGRGQRNRVPAGSRVPEAQRPRRHAKLPYDRRDRWRGIRPRPPAGLRRTRTLRPRGRSRRRLKRPTSRVLLITTGGEGIFYIRRQLVGPSCRKGRSCAGSARTGNGRWGDSPASPQARSRACPFVPLPGRSRCRGSSREVFIQPPISFWFRLRRR